MVFLDNKKAGNFTGRSKIKKIKKKKKEEEEKSK